MSLPARFLTVRPLLMSAASALPLMTWLRRTALTVASSGAEAADEAGEGGVGGREDGQVGVAAEGAHQVGP